MNKPEVVKEGSTYRLVKLWSQAMGMLTMGGDGKMHQITEPQPYFILQKKYVNALGEGVWVDFTPEENVNAAFATGYLRPPQINKSDVAGIVADILGINK